jgi:hypothetical protein
MLDRGLQSNFSHKLNKRVATTLNCTLDNGHGLAFVPLSPTPNLVGDIENMKI